MSWHVGAHPFEEELRLIKSDYIMITMNSAMSYLANQGEQLIYLHFLVIYATLECYMECNQFFVSP